jgi:transcriptional regulator GlxA family with amidase domain
MMLFLLLCLFFFFKRMASLYQVPHLSEMTKIQRFLPFTPCDSSSFPLCFFNPITPERKSTMPSQRVSKHIGRTGGNTRRVILFSVPPAMELDIVGPMSVFMAVNQRKDPLHSGYEIELVTSDRNRMISGSLGLSLPAHKHYREVRGSVDTLLVVGGTGPLTVRDASILRWLRKMSSRVRRLGSVCTGSFLLAEAGLLNGRRATTHWALTREFAARYPHVTVDPNPIWVQDGHIYTSAGVTAGMDLALGFVEEDYGNDIALSVAKDLVLFLRRPGGQAQFSASLSLQASGRKSFTELQVWIKENLDKDLSIDVLASRTAMSPRNFARVFVRELGTTPAHYVEQVRLEAARQQLEQTEKSLEGIASSCGFGSAELMRRTFLRLLKITPGRYRDHFGPASTKKQRGVFMLAL